MKISTDGSDLRWRPAGLGRYLDGLLHGIERELEGDDHLTIYYNSLPRAKLFGQRVQERFIRLPRSTSYNQLGLAVALQVDGSDVYLGGANIVPIVSRKPRVVVIHDALAFRHPETKTPIVTRYLQRWMKLSAQRADRIIAISRWSASEAVRFLGANDEAIDVVYQGVNERFKPGDQPTPPDLLSLARVPFVLHVGAFEWHKNPEMTVQASNVLRQRGHDLVVVRTGATHVRTEGPVIDLGVVDDERLLWLYRNATAVCVPSRHEGFGLPVVEAMACGTPVVASRASGLPEAGGDAALYAEPEDINGFATALERLMNDPDERAHRIQAGLAQAAKFRWETAARRVLEIVGETAARRNAERKGLKRADE